MSDPQGQVQVNRIEPDRFAYEVESKLDGQSVRQRAEAPSLNELLQAVRALGLPLPDEEQVI